MSTPAERAFIQHLVLPDSLAQIIERDLPPEIIASEALRPIFQFAVDYWHSVSARGVAPSPDAMREHFGNTLVEHEIDLDVDPSDELPWAIEFLSGAYIDAKWQRWTRDFSGGMANADVLAKPDLLNQAIGELMTIQRVVSSKNEHVEMRRGVGFSIDAFYERQRLAQSGLINGAILGLPEVDTHLAGIREGELAIIGGPPKLGKSWMMIFSALANFILGKSVALFTLELPVETVVDRAACMAAGVDSGRWDRGECTPEEVERVREWQAIIMASDTAFHVIQPEPGRRTAQHMTRRAKTLADVMYVDQLTFVEPEPETQREPRWRQVGDSLHVFKAQISTGKRMPLILAHQLSRDGIKGARKRGYAEMEDFAEASEVERTADLAMIMWATMGQRDLSACYLQTVAARRVEWLDWQMWWRPWEPVIAPDGSARPRVSIDRRVNLRAEA